MLDDGARTALDRNAYVSLATFRRSGVPVKTPVWFAHGDGRFYVFTEADAGKVKRLRNDPRVRVAPCSVTGRITGKAVEGTARVRDEPEIVEAAYTALRSKYGWQMRAVDFFSRLAGRIDGRAILELEL